MLFKRVVELSIKLHASRLPWCGTTRPLITTWQHSYKALWRARHIPSAERPPPSFRVSLFVHRYVSIMISACVSLTSFVQTFHASDGEVLACVILVRDSVFTASLWSI